MEPGFGAGTRRGTALTYVVERRAAAAPGWLPDFITMPFREKKVVVRCVLSRQGLVISYGTDVELQWDLSSGHRLITSHSTEECLQSIVPLVPAGAGLKAQATRVCPAEGTRSAMCRHDLSPAKKDLELWALASPIADPVATRALWQLLIPGQEKVPAIGVPADLLLRDADDPGRTLARIRLVEVARADPSLRTAAPAGYRPVADVVRPEFSPPEEPAKAPAQAARRALRADLPKVNLAWITRQESLDVFSDVINAVVGTVESFSDQEFVARGGRRGELGLVIDWWQQMEPHIEDPEVVPALQRLLVAYRVQNGEMLDSMGDLERWIYHDQVLSSPLCRGPNAPLCRVTAFLGTFLPWLARQRSIDTDTAFNRVAAGEWEALTKPQVVGLGVSDISMNATDVIHFSARNFRKAKLELGELSTFSTAKFERGHVELTMDIPFITGEFDFETSLASTSQADACAFFTFGLCAAFVANSGRGTLSLRNVQLVLDVTPTPADGGTVNFATMLNRDRSSFAVSLFLSGANPIHGWIQDIIAEVGHWQNYLGDPILDALEGAVGNPLISTLANYLFSWPWSLNIGDGPPILASGSSFADGSGTLLARLANSAGVLPVPNLAQPKPAHSGPMSLVLDAQYVNAWALERIGVYQRTTTIQPDWEGALGIPDPDPRPRQLAPVGELKIPKNLWPEGFPQPQLDGLVENCDPPPDIPPTYRNRTVLVRSALQVTMPPAGPATWIAKVSLDYRLRFEATTITAGHRRIVVPMPVCVDTSVIDGGPIERRFGHELTAFAARAVAGERLPGGYTAGQYAAYQADIERARRRHSFGDSPAMVGTPDTPPELPDRPGRPGSPGSPGFGEPPEPPVAGRPRDLPTVFCEPPHCEWVFGVSENGHGTYIEATATVSINVVVGFDADPGAAIWLPGISLRGTDQPVIQLHDLKTERAYAQLDQNLVRQTVSSVILGDANGLLQRLLSAQMPVTQRTLIPAAATSLGTIPRDVLNILVFRQAGNSRSLAYQIADGFAYWPIRIEQHLTDLLGR